MYSLMVIGVCGLLYLNVYLDRFISSFFIRLPASIIVPEIVLFPQLPLRIICTIKVASVLMSHKFRLKTNHMQKISFLSNKIPEKSQCVVTDNIEGQLY